MPLPAALDRLVVPEDAHDASYFAASARMASLARVSRCDICSIYVPWPIDASRCDVASPAGPVVTIGRRGPSARVVFGDAGRSLFRRPWAGVAGPGGGDFRGDVGAAREFCRGGLRDAWGCRVVVPAWCSSGAGVCRVRSVDVARTVAGLSRDCRGVVARKMA